MLRRPVTPQTMVLGLFGNRAEAFEAADDTPLSPDGVDTIGDVIAVRYGRRDVLRGSLGVVAATTLFGADALAASETGAAGNVAAANAGGFEFTELSAGVDTTHHVADGFDAQVLIRWGDPVLADAPAFDPHNQTAEAQARQFGYNNDYVGFLPLNADASRGLLCVNHEYSSEEVMFPGIVQEDRSDFSYLTPELVAIEMAAHGGSIIEIARDGDGAWRTVPASALNRRITASETAMTVDGPAAGHERLRTSTDPDGTQIVGTFNNCAGGMTPWGTYLMAEENFHGYFWSDDLDALKATPQAASYARYGVPGKWYAWGQFDDRFNVDKEPNEPNRFGWIVEVDPLDPTSTPVKHTALGRFRHEGAECILNGDGHAVIYSGDDARFDYVYRFVSAEAYRPVDDAHNRTLLSNGTLSVARYDADGTVTWLPLVQGVGPLTEENGFTSQADVMIDARLAADLLGATKMDRPEDVQPAADGRVYVMLTNNSKRKVGDEDTANPRAKNRFGHIIEMRAPDGDHTADRYTWDILVKCGDPSIAEVGAAWNPETSADGWFGSPDNCAIDGEGRLWVATDQGRNWARTGKADGLYAVETEGERRGTSQLFFRVPIGAELCGPTFTPDSETLFLAVQHPGTDGTRNFPGFERDSTFEDPATRWPDFKDGVPPRPSVMVVTRRGGGRIG